MHNAAYVDLYISSGFRRWRPALGLTVSDTLLSLGRARGPAANGRYQGTADIAGDRGGCRRHAPADRPRTSSRSSRMTAPLQLDGSLPTRCCLLGATYGRQVSERSRRRRRFTTHIARWTLASSVDRHLRTIHPRYSHRTLGHSRSRYQTAPLGYYVLRTRQRISYKARCKAERGCQ